MELGELDDDDRAAFRNERLGYVFQFHFLLPEFTVLENVIIPLLRRGTVARSEAEDRGYDVLQRLGLEELYARKPGQISGGQQQRVAIARAVANNPSLILADEPTGNLDTKTSVEVMDIFQRLNGEKGITVLLITHEPDIAQYGTRIIGFRDGVIVNDHANQKRRWARQEMEELAALAESA